MNRVHMGKDESLHHASQKYRTAVLPVCDAGQAAAASPWSHLCLWAWSSPRGGVVDLCKGTRYSCTAR
jgi:hypothetical protein